MGAFPGVPHPLWLDKYDGQVVCFEPARIQRAIAAAGHASGEFGEDMAAILANALLVHLPDGSHVDIEQVQERIELVLMEAGYYQSARVCIVHHEMQRHQLSRETLLNAVMAMQEYLSASS